MLYFYSTYNKITVTKGSTRCSNIVTKKCIYYTDATKSIIDLALDQQLDYIESNTKGIVLQIITAELVHRGIIIPVDKEPCEEEYLNKITLILPINPTFFKCTHIPEAALSIAEKGSVIFCGLPYDIGAKNPGTRFGPELLRSRSNTMIYKSNKPSIIDLTMLKDIFHKKNVYDLGDINLPQDTISNSLNRIKDIVQLIPNTSIPFFIGGDHLLSISLIDGLYAKAKDKFSVVQLDSHLDVEIWGEFKNQVPKKLSPPTHANFISWLKNKYPELDLYQIGVSTYQSTDINYTEEVCGYLKNIGLQITNTEILMSPFAEILKRIPNSQIVYLTIDIDVLNAVYMNATGYPSPMGISIKELLRIIDYITKHNTIIGIDIMEFGKTSKYDEHSLMSDIICDLILTILKNILK